MKAKLLAIGLFLTLVTPAASHEGDDVIVDVGGVLPGAPAPGSSTSVDNPRHGLEEVGFHPLYENGFNAVVWPHATRDGRLFAGVGAIGYEVLRLGNDVCPSETDLPPPLGPTKSGVRLVDVTDPRNPVLAARIATVPGSSTAEVRFAALSTPWFTGDILAHNLEPCGATVDGALVLSEETINAPLPQTGFQLYDISEPTGPVKMGTYNNGGVGIHNLTVFSRPDLGRAFIAAAAREQPVPDLKLKGEIQIVEITDPSGGLDGILEGPIGRWKLADADAQTPEPGPTVADLCRMRGSHSHCFPHDVWLSADGRTAYVSYWDAGLILLDVSNPAAPRFIGQTQTLSDVPGQANEGNTHSAIPYFAGGRHFVITGDEDFDGPKEAAVVTVNRAPDPDLQGEDIFGREFAGVANQSRTRPLEDFEPDGLGSFPAIVADDEWGCSYQTGRTFTEAGKHWIAVARTGPQEPAGLATCPDWQLKIAAAQLAGADGLIVVNSDGLPADFGTGETGDIPAILIPYPDGLRLIEATRQSDDLEDVAVTLGLGGGASPLANPWGFMRVVDVTDENPANWREVSRFGTPHTAGFPQPARSYFSAHNPILGPDGRVYFSWFGDGVRVLQPGTTPGTFDEVAWFVPQASDHPNDLDSDPHGIRPDNYGFWQSWPVCHPISGDLLVLNSDGNRGLYILRSLLSSCEVIPVTPSKVIGGGAIAGSTSDGDVNFGLNAKSGSSPSGHVHVLDAGAKARVLSETITSVASIPSLDGKRVQVRGTCRVNGGAENPCETLAIDREVGSDELHVRVETPAGITIYQTGGPLVHGSVEVR